MRKRTSPHNSLPKKDAIACAVCDKNGSKYKCPKCRAPYCSVQCSKDHKAKCAAATTSSSDGTATAAQTEGTVAEQASRGTMKRDSKYLPSDLLLRDPLANMERRRRMAEEDEDDDSDLDEPGWKLSTEMMDRINQSAWLRKELADGGLRQMIREIDVASDDEDEDGDGRSAWKRRRKDNVAISPRELSLARAKYTNSKFASFVDRMLLTAGIMTRVAGDGTIGGLGEDVEDEFGDISHGGRLILAPVPRRQDNDSIVDKELTGKSLNEEDSDSDSKSSQTDSETSSGGDTDDSDSDE